MRLLLPQLPFISNIVWCRFLSKALFIIGWLMPYFDNCKLCHWGQSFGIAHLGDYTFSHHLFSAPDSQVIPDHQTSVKDYVEKQR